MPMIFTHSYQAVRLAKQANVDPEQLVKNIFYLMNYLIPNYEGVLTKPGAIGALSSRSEVLKGNKYQTQHGYYCVCLHDDEDHRARG